MLSFLNETTSWLFFQVVSRTLALGNFLDIGEKHLNN
jgi:hypothetical protein